MTRQTVSTSGSGSVATETVSASSCSWKTATSLDDECFLEPRTCRECLNETPTTGETCVLTDSGICMSVKEYEETLASTADVYFLAGNATYCGNNSSDHCLQLNSCEASTWLSYARQRLPLIALAVDQDTPEGCTFATDIVNEDTGAVELDSDESSDGKDTLSSEDQCTWYQNSTLCSTPRTCYDCLNTATDSGDACTITPEGYCTTLATNYNYKLDFRSVSSSGVDNGYYYPSTNTTYCEPSDAACSNCDIGRSASNSASYCVGSDGCVCVAFCQSSNWQETVIAEKCEASTTSSTKIYGTEFPWETFIIFLSLAVVVVLAVILGVWRVKHILQARRRESMRLRRSEMRRFTRSLELPAWKAMREELIDSKVDPVGEGRGRLRPM